MVAFTLTGPVPTSTIPGAVGQSATLAATGGASGNPVVFSVDPASGPGVCSVSGTGGTDLTYDAPGTCLVDADQAGDVSYAPNDVVPDGGPAARCPNYANNVSVANLLVIT